MRYRSWDAAELGLLRQLAAEGRFASEIAERLGRSPTQVRAIATLRGIALDHDHRCTARCFRLGRGRLCPSCAGDPRDGGGYHAFDCPLRDAPPPAPAIIPRPDEEVTMPP